MSASPPLGRTLGTRIKYNTKIRSFTRSNRTSVTVYIEEISPLMCRRGVYNFAYNFVVQLYTGALKRLSH